MNTVSPTLKSLISVIAGHEGAAYFCFMKMSKGKEVIAGQEKEPAIYDTIIIGGSQAGLSMGYYLQKINKNFLIIDTEKRVGDTWRKRWDSLKLFTPPVHNTLPGMANSFDNAGRTSKEQIADYLEAYSLNFKLPTLMDTRVLTLDRQNEGYLLTTTNGVLRSRCVVIATGSNPLPKVPDLARDLHKGIFQIHSSQYKNPASVPEGEVLVVGCATSGMEIALELAAGTKTMISGQPTTVLPRLIFKIGNLNWLIFRHVFNINNPIGRRIKPKFLRGGATAPTLLHRLNQSPVIRKPRLVKVENGFPAFENGEVANPKSVIWCTGYQADFSWINFDLKKQSGWPLVKRGVAPEQPGLYFLGMPFQNNATSGLVGGVGADARYIAEHIRKFF